MQRKIIRIFLKSIGFLLLFLLLTGFALLLAVQSTSFQTWLGKKASSYLSAELQSKISIDKINIKFFKRAEFNGVIVLDKHQDTLFLGDVEIKLKHFNYRHQEITLDQTILKNVTSKLIQYKNDSTFNYQFLMDYFSSDTSTKNPGSPWKVGFGDLVLNNVNFAYQNKHYSQRVSNFINYDNILVKHSYGTISDFKFLGDTIYATLAGFKTEEQSGITIKQLNTSAKLSQTQLLCEDLQLETNRSLLMGRIELKYSKWSDYLDFINRVDMNCVIKDSSYIDTKDIAVFAEDLAGLDEQVKLSGIIKGTISNISLQNFKFSFGKYSQFKGDLAIQGLPDFSTSYIHLNAKKLSSNYYDLIHLPVYPFNENKKMPIPERFSSLGTFSYKGKFDGFINDFTAFGKLNTAVGNVESQISISTGKSEKDFTYNGKIKTENLDLGFFLDVADVGDLTMTGEINGKGLSVNDIEADFTLDVKAINYRNYNYQNIKVDGSLSDRLFNGLLISKDQNADLDFNGSINFDKKVPEMEFISTINYLNLNNINLLSDKDSGIVSTQMFINTSGSSIDDLSGQINFDNTIYRTNTKTFKLSTFNIELDQANIAKKIKLNSAYLNATLSGNYKLSNLQGVFQSFLYTYYPAFTKKPLQHKIYSDSLNFNLTVKNFNAINQLFMKDLMLSPGTKLEGNFSAGQNKINILASSNQFKYKTLSLRAMHIDLNESGSNLIGQLKAQSLNISDSVLIENIVLSSKSEDKLLGYTLSWDDKKETGNKGLIAGKMSFNPNSLDMSLDTIVITKNQSTWHLEKPNSLSLFNDGSMIVKPLRIIKEDQEILIEGNYSQLTGDSLVLKTTQVHLKEFNPLMKLIGLKLDGFLNGEIILSNTNNKLAFRGNVGMQKFKINDNTLGEVKLNAKYNTTENYIDLNGYTALGLGEMFDLPSRDITFEGRYFLNRSVESIDINFEANPANLRLLNPLLEGFLTIKNGFVNGNGKIHGTPDNIKIDGKLHIFNSEVKFDYTNVTYFVSGDIEIMPDQIRFTDLLMRDKNMRSTPQGTINGNIFHNNFENIQLDYDISYRNMLVMNTKELDNTLFYGKVYSTGQVGLYGYLNNLNLLIIDTVTKNSKFFLPMDGPAELNDEDYIHFVVKDTIKPESKNPLSGFNLNMFLHLTPDLEAFIIMDRKNGDMLNVEGLGNVNLKINTLGKFEMFGDYVITEGEYLFTLKTLINKKFAIDAGSHISWSGDPMNAEIDVVTKYKQRTSVAPLLNDTTGQYAGRQPVDCKLMIEGKLATPNIFFKIDVPNLESTAMARINNVLSDEAELNRQVFSFLLFGNFVVPQIYTSQGGGVSAGGAAAATGSEMLSNRASEFINSYFGNLTGITDMQVGVNYRPGTSTSSQEFDVALSKQFMNKRMSVDGNFGVNSNPSNSSTGLIGDVTVDYKLSDDGRYRVKAFNRTNDNTQITIMGGPYTQGIGAFYREEFDSFTELMNRYKTKGKKIKEDRKK